MINTENLLVDEIHDDNETAESEIKTSGEFLRGVSKKVNYINDLELTTKLLKESKEYKDYALFKENNPGGEYKYVKREAPSDELCLNFLKIYEGITRKPNFSGYSDDYKEEFFSKAQYLFIRHWFKFDPLKVRKNYVVNPNSKLKSVNDIEVKKSKNGVKLKEKIDAGELTLKPEEAFEGGFSWFTMLCATACVDSITMFKNRREKQRALIKSVVDKNTLSDEQIKFNYDWIDL